jgi:hypothetical protein
MTEAALEGLRPSMEAALDAAPSGTTTGAIEARVDALVEQMQQLALANEGGIMPNAEGRWRLVRNRQYREPALMPTEAFS